jgi:hypothetical protein
VVSDGVAGVPGRPGKAETARRWNELVHSYSASGHRHNLLYRVSDRIQRPLGPTAHRERAWIDALMRRQGSVTASIAAGPSALSAARPSPTPLPSPSPRALLARSSVWSPSPSGGASDVQRVLFADIPQD